MNDAQNTLRDGALRSGSDAVQALRALGWDAADLPQLQVRARSGRTARTTLSRIQTFAVTLRSIGDAAGGSAGDVLAGDVSADDVRLIVVVGGYGSLRPVDGRPVLLTPGDVAVVPADAVLTLGIAEEIQAIDCRAPLHLLSDRGQLALRVDQVTAASGEAVARFDARAQELLDADVEEAGEALERALFELLRTMTPVGPTALDLTARETELLQQAAAVADAHQGERSYSVQHLAADLGVSRVYLHRVFAKTGQTPSAYLKSVRRKGYVTSTAA